MKIQSTDFAILKRYVSYGGTLRISMPSCISSTVVVFVVIVVVVVVVYLHRCTLTKFPIVR